MKIWRYNFLFFATVFSGCSTYYYQPTGVNAPLFTGGGQAHFSAAGSYGILDYNEGDVYNFDAQASYSPINHLAFIGNYSSFKLPDEYHVPNLTDIKVFSHSFEEGVGSYWTSKVDKYQLVADFYAGYGTGFFHGDVNMNNHRFFIQPGIGVRSPMFDASFNIHVSFLQYNHFDPEGFTDDGLKDYGFIDSRGRRIDQLTYTFIEPALTLRTGYKFIKAQFQAVISQNVNNIPWRYSNLRCTAGIYFSLEEMLHFKRK